MDFESGADVSPAPFVENGLTLTAPLGYALNPAVGGNPGKAFISLAVPLPVGGVNPVPVLTSSAGAFDLISIDVSEFGLSASESFTVRCIRAVGPVVDAPFTTDATLGNYETFPTPTLTNCTSVEIGLGFTVLDNLVTSTPPT